MNFETELNATLEDDFLSELKEIDGTEVPFLEVFSPEFMQSHTDFESFDAMLKASPWEVEDDEDLLAILDDEFEEYVADATPFESWHEMRQTAQTAWLKRQLS